jgi:uncharacterized membrane protein
MRTSRVEAFSDGVLAIIITIMVLELKVPTGNTLAAFRHTTGTALLTYVLSFIYVGIYWNNHHHMFQLTRHITGSVLWANLGLLFFLSLFPYTTAWVDNSGYARTPVVAYGINLLAAGAAYNVLQRTILSGQGDDSALKQAIGRDIKGKGSVMLYATGIACAALASAATPAGIWVAVALYVLVAMWWLVPDRRIERVIRERGTDD